MKLAWGAKVSPEFRRKLIGFCGAMRIDPSFMMACIAWESGRSFRSDVRNAAGSGAVGLIQFMPQTAAHLGTSSSDLAAMTPEVQLDFVAKYFAPHSGRIKTLSDCYMAILWPAAVGKPENHILFRRDDPHRPKTYLQNAGLDIDHDGDVEKQECARKVRAALDDGMREPNVWTDEVRIAAVHPQAAPAVIMSAQSWLNDLVALGAIEGPPVAEDGRWGIKTAAKWREAVGV